MPRRRNSLESKLLPSPPKLKLGEYTINPKSSRRMGSEISAMVLEKGTLHLQAIENPLAIFTQKKNRMKVLFSPKERHTILAHAIKRKLYRNVLMGKLTQREEVTLNNIVSTLGKLGEEQLITLFKKQTKSTQKEFITYLIENTPKLLRQQELDLSKKSQN